MFKRSEFIDLLGTALYKAQYEIKPPEKKRVGKISGTNKSGKYYEYSYKYADLSDILEVIKKPLFDNQLSVSQIMNFKPGSFSLETAIIHSSGQYISGNYPLPEGKTAQELGSAITYARRYALCAILNIVADEDDDGAIATQAPPEVKKTPPKPYYSKPVSATPAPVQDWAEDISFDALVTEPNKTKEVAHPFDSKKFTEGKFAGMSFSLFVTKDLKQASSYAHFLSTLKNLSAEKKMFLEYATLKGLLNISIRGPAL